MVKVRDDYPLDHTGAVNVEQWASDIVERAGLESQAAVLLVKAASIAREAKEAIKAEHYYSHVACSFETGLEMAQILSDLQVDQEALLAAIIYRSVREERLPISKVAQHFGDQVAGLITGVLRMAAISQLRNDSEGEVFGKHSVEQTNNVRKMLVSMVDDVRVALIKLAERTCVIREAKDSDPKIQQKVAKEIADIYAPLAHRLGIGHIKWELEDLSFRYLKPIEYKKIASMLSEKRLDRQGYITKMIESISTQINKSDIQADISGRAKHIYSIWKKMQRKAINFSEVYDIRAVRILVPTTKDCYEVLGIVHTLWRNIAHEFDDYIAAPKDNGYRSLHTAVIGPENKVLEVQIRSQIMHEEAEFGVCAHWRYKNVDSKTTVDSYEQKLAWLRQVLEWHDDLGEESLADNLHKGIAEDRVYVFTRDGHVIDLPQGATPLDFAYRIHTEIGHCCRGAKVNSRIVPLNYTLKTSDQVDILKATEPMPSRDWLVEGLGYLGTTKARAKVRQWFSEQDKERNIADGKYLLNKEFKRLSLPSLEKEVIEILNFSTADSVYAAIGAGDLGVGHVANVSQKYIDKQTLGDKPILSFIKRSSVADKEGVDHGISIEGVGNLLTTMAKCCGPIPGDEIIGFITLGRGVSIHRQDCSNLLQLHIDEPERILKVDWSNNTQRQYAIDIVIQAFDRHGLLKDITMVLDNDHVNISGLKVHPPKGNIVGFDLSIDVRDLSQLSRILGLLSQLPNVSSVKRMKR